MSELLKGRQHLQRPYLAITVGDKVRDCDTKTPETKRIKVVIEVLPSDVRVKGTDDVGMVTVVPRAKIHTKPAKKSGYYLMPRA